MCIRDRVVRVLGEGDWLSSIEGLQLCAYQVQHAAPWAGLLVQHCYEDGQCFGLPVALPPPPPDPHELLSWAAAAVSRQLRQWRVPGEVGCAVELRRGPGPEGTLSLLWGPQMRACFDQAAVQRHACAQLVSSAHLSAPVRLEDSLRVVRCSEVLCVQLAQQEEHPMPVEFPVEQLLVLQGTAYRLAAFVQLAHEPPECSLCVRNPFTGTWTGGAAAHQRLTRAACLLWYVREDAVQSAAQPLAQLRAQLLSHPLSSRSNTEDHEGSQGSAVEEDQGFDTRWSCAEEQEEGPGLSFV
eukprot:TRINITY_DN28363_c0_g1_i2.p1 TRINITY_DN28363_c0_g1~~TRINITY_DN28363_c0_g1_i2.p1  ORF type:complete len:297 (+),score=92.00 TRINITY_DN28363_c0_g1_i2:94-984(+)